METTSDGKSKKCSAAKCALMMLWEKVLLAYGQ